VERCLLADVRRQAISFYEELLGSPFPYASYKQVFVEDSYTLFTSGASCSILRSVRLSLSLSLSHSLNRILITFAFDTPSRNSTHLLHDETIIDQTFDTIRLQCLAIATQWFGNFITVKYWSDSWLTLGIAGYLTMLCYKNIFGTNEYRYRMMQVPRSFGWPLCSLELLISPSSRCVHVGERCSRGRDRLAGGEQGRDHGHGR